MSFLERTEGIWEYCRENWMLLVAAGLVIMILILSVWLIRLSRRDSGEDEEAASEGETSVEVPSADEQSPAEIMSSSGTESLESFSEPELEKPSEPETEGRPEGTGPEPEMAAARGLVEHLIQNAEKTGGAASQKVESIELKIEKAQLTIHYADADDEKLKKEEFSEAGEGEKGVERKDAEEKDAEKKDAGNVDFEGENAESAEKAEAEEAAQIPLEKSAIRKFGPDNRNRTRSGRIFTEEELQEQIRE